jgi:hypothetical protein
MTTPQKLMTAFGNAVDDLGPTSDELVDAAVNILIIAVLRRLKEAETHSSAAPMKAFSKQLRELVELTLAQEGGGA